jgi:hypothetical protein
MKNHCFCFFYFSVNKISSLADFEECSNLQELYLRKNCIQEISDLGYLQVRMHNNFNYTLFCVYAVQRLKHAQTLIHFFGQKFPFSSVGQVYGKENIIVYL